MPRLSGDWSLRPGQPELLGEEAAQNHLSSRDSPIAGGGAEAGSAHSVDRAVRVSGSDLSQLPPLSP